MGWPVFPFSAGGFSFFSGLGVEASSHTYKELGYDLTDFTEREEEIFKLRNPDAGKPRDILNLFQGNYSKYPCIKDAFKKEDIKTISLDENTEEVKFGEGSQGCISVWGIKEERPYNKWEGSLNIAWSLFDNNNKRVLLSSVYTKDGKLYSRGSFYFFKKQGENWSINKFKLQERIPKEVTEENLKEFVILGNHNNVEGMMLETFDLNNICSESKGDNCSVSIRHKKIEGNWELVLDSCKDTGIYKWSSNYKFWTGSNGLFSELKDDIKSTVRGCYNIKKSNL